ncbi:hypothetical protein [Natrinema salaciae]|uniref:Type I restriction enzyme R protein N terminus (HSDR_N) n=1 Tax=Natrinema salaciae TaxID=1186196 RepID=A0A1H9MVF2_9EURY|nr:hypothetical protein [Natrinema salaciae]SER27686.1 hypothetical protein SAMN04489841_3514 [Natrinema salaciae]
MNEEEVRQVVSDALERVAEEDADLLEYDVNERSITHKLAVYLREEVDEEWDVDVEYNRVGEDDVSKAIPMEYLKSKISDDVDPEDLDAKTVYPDVIVHKRGEHYENLLVIETKKSGSSGEYDREKLTAYVEELEYDFGVFVTLSVGGQGEDSPYDCDWYPFEE